MESLMNTDDFFFSAEDDALAEKIAAFFPKNNPTADAAYMANVAIGNIKPDRLNDAVGQTFRLCGYHAKSIASAERQSRLVERIIGAAVERSSEITYAVKSRDDLSFTVQSLSAFIYDNTRNLG